MVSRPVIAAFRFGSAILMAASVIYALLYGSGPILLLYFTIQSNILGIVSLFLGGLSAISGGRISSYPGLSFIATISLLATGIVFWCLLSPFVDIPLLSVTNLCHHLFCPLLVIVDRLLFYYGCAPSPRDAFIAMIHPVLYLVQSVIVGGLKLVDFDIGWFPYPFLDFYTYGAWVILFVAVFFFAILALAEGWALMERRRDKKRAQRMLAALRRRFPEDVCAERYSISFNFCTAIPSAWD